MTDAQETSENIRCAQMVYRTAFLWLLSAVYGRISLTGGMNIIPISHSLLHFLCFPLCESAGGCRTPRGLCL